MSIFFQIMESIKWIKILLHLLLQWVSSCFRVQVNDCPFGVCFLLNQSRRHLTNFFSSNFDFHPVVHILKLLLTGFKLNLVPFSAPKCVFFIIILQSNVWTRTIESPRAEQTTPTWSGTKFQFSYLYLLIDTLFVYPRSFNSFSTLRIPLNWRKFSQAYIRMHRKYRSKTIC